MKRLAVAVVLIALIACSATYTVELDAPYCPVSDSARAKADSVSVLCFHVDTTVKR